MVARLLWEQDAAGSNPVSPMPRDARSQLAVQPPESGGFFVPTGSGAPLQSQHGARSVTTTRCGVDGNMHNGLSPSPGPVHRMGLFCAPDLAWTHAGSSWHGHTVKHLATLLSPITGTRAGRCWRGLRHPSHAEAWPGDTSGHSLSRISLGSNATQHARVKRSLREGDGWVCE